MEALAYKMVIVSTWILCTGVPFPSANSSPGFPALPGELLLLPQVGGRGARPWRRPDFTSPRGVHLVFSSCFHQMKTWNQGVRSRVWSAENDSLEEGREVLGRSGCFSYPGADWREEREETHLQNKTNPSGQEGIYGQCHFLSPGYFLILTPSE